MSLATELVPIGRGTWEEDGLSTSEGSSLGRHILTPEERLQGLSLANSPEGVKARVESRRRNAENRRQYVRDLYEWGMSIGTIATKVGLSDATVRRMTVGTSRPRYGSGVIECPHDPPHRY